MDENEKRVVGSRLEDHLEYLKELIENVPASRERSLAITKLEECEMWIARAIAQAGPKVEVTIGEQPKG